MELNLKIKDSLDKHTKLREEKLNYFKKKGFPNKRLEDWKFTDLDKILNSNFDQLTPFKEKTYYKPEKIFDFDHYSITNLNGALIGYDLFRKGSREATETLFTEVKHLKDHSIFFWSAL